MFSAHPVLGVFPARSQGHSLVLLYCNLVLHCSPRLARYIALECYIRQIVEAFYNMYAYVMDMIQDRFLIVQIQYCKTCSFTFVFTIVYGSIGSKPAVCRKSGTLYESIT